MQVLLHKYQGTGNDFIIIDNRKTNITLSEEQVAWLCHRRFGIGADGLMMLEQAEGYDFRMVYYNSDGKESSMCGNGGRCLSAFAHRQGIASRNLHFTACDGEHFAEIISQTGNTTLVRLKMNDVDTIEQTEEAFILNTGSPHYVCIVEDVQSIDVYHAGKEIRYSETFKPHGLNVNFVQIMQPGVLFVRTYERGVEDETFSCGTGVTASALAYSKIKDIRKVAIITKGGNLQVEFEVDKTGYRNIYLEGNADYVFQTEITL